MSGFASLKTTVLASVAVTDSTIFSIPALKPPASVKPLPSP